MLTFVRATQSVAPNVLGTRLRAKRTAAGLSREKLAVRADLSVATLARIEGGDYRPRLASLEALAAALGTTAADLLAPAEDGPEAAAS